MTTEAIEIVTCEACGEPVGTDGRIEECGGGGLIGICAAGDPPLRCELCGKVIEAEEGEVYHELMACRTCVIGGEQAKLDIAREEYNEWLDNQMTEEQRLGKGGY